METWVAWLVRPKAISLPMSRMRTRRCNKWYFFTNNDKHAITFVLTNNIFQTQAGEESVELHGCIGCHTKVWGPEDAETVCDVCQGNRYDREGKPKEYIIHFPLKKRLEKLLLCPDYREAVRWEYKRAKDNSEYITGRFSFCFRH